MPFSSASRRWKERWANTGKFILEGRIWEIVTWIRNLPFPLFYLCASGLSALVTDQQARGWPSQVCQCHQLEEGTAADFWRLQNLQAGEFWSLDPTWSNHAWFITCSGNRCKDCSKTVALMIPLIIWCIFSSEVLLVPWASEVVSKPWLLHSQPAHGEGWKVVSCPFMGTCTEEETSEIQNRCQRSPSVFWVI